MKDLYIMRHGQTLFNVRRKIQGWCDSPLTEEGKKQALKAKEILKDIHFDHYYCSTAERCSDTLELITDKPYIRLKGLKERNFGIYESESEDLHPEIKRYDDFYKQFGGETAQEVKERMYQTLVNIMNKEDHQKVLVVSHSGANMCFYSLFGDPQTLRQQGFTNCSILHYTYDHQQFHFIEMINV